MILVPGQVCSCSKVDFIALQKGCLASSPSVMLVGHSVMVLLP